MIIKKMFIFLLIPFCMACQKKDSKSSAIENEQNNRLMEEVLVRQLKKGSKKYYKNIGIEVTKDQIDIDDIKATVEICKKILLSNGFIKVSNEKFNSKCNLIFSRVIDPNSDKNFLYVNYFDKCDKKINFNPNNGVDYQGTYIIKKENFITDFFYIPELINYKKEFLKTSEIEDYLPKNYKNIDGEEIKVELWKDVENNKDLVNSLANQRKKNIENLVNRNKYLFNDNKASLVWLKFNDQEFLESLVKIFGFVQDKDLLKWVLDNNLKNDADEFGKILWTKTCDNKIIFHKEAFDLMNEQDVKKKKKIITNLQNYISDFKNEDLKFNQEAKIKALVCYYATKLSASIEPSAVYQFFPSVNGEEYEKEFIKNNYYNISDFKKIYDDTKTGGVSYPGMLD